MVSLIRRKNIDVLFTTGTDEHGLKVEKAAKKNKKDPQEFVDNISHTSNST